MPDQQQLDLQARFSLKHLLGINAEAWVDVLNLLALRTVTVVEERADDPNFGGMVNRMPPLRLRVGLRYEL